MKLSKYKEQIRDRFNSLSSKRRFWKEKNSYYYKSQEAYFKFLIPSGQNVLELGCGTGELLDALQPARGVGVDLSENMVKLAKDSFPDLEFVHGDVENPLTWNINETFDFIIISDLVGLLEDVQTCFEALRPYCTSNTRIIVSYYNFLWAPILKFAEKLNAKMPQKIDNWLSPGDISNLLYLADFETVKTERRLIFPKKIPVISNIFEFFGSLPLFNLFCLSHFVVARMREKTENKNSEKSVTVLIPCRNERGNIEPAIKRTQDMGTHTEIIFVDGHSEDGTPEEIKRVIKKYSKRDIKFIHACAKGNFRETNKFLYTVFNIYEYYDLHKPEKIGGVKLSKKILEMAAIKIGYING
jgi:SAM-dependent methyltransferase